VLESYGITLIFRLDNFLRLPYVSSAAGKRTDAQWPARSVYQRKGSGQMIIGVPREIKNHEYRVALTPSGVKELQSGDHRVIVQKGAGLASGFNDADYIEAEAMVMASRRQLFGSSEMIVKVKEPLPEEYELLREGQIVFTFFHFAASRALTRAMIRRKIIAIPYETIQLEDGSLPILRPMSEIAGRLAVQAGAVYLERPHRGSGILLPRVSGAAPAKVTVLGGGVAGSSAAASAAALGAHVTVLDIDPDRLARLKEILPANAAVLFSGEDAISKLVPETDLLIGAVLSPGRRAPVLVSKSLVRQMRPGSVIVDIAVDQGGCIETTRPTTYDKPTYAVHGVTHYCVANLPGAVPRTSTPALTAVTLPYVREIADKGYVRATTENPAIGKAITLVEGKAVREDIAGYCGVSVTRVADVMG
jgi:alanine dehydrogenase